MKDHLTVAGLTRTPEEAEQWAIYVARTVDDSVCASANQLCRFDKLEGYVIAVNAECAFGDCE